MYAQKDYQTGRVIYYLSVICIECYNIKMRYRLKHCKNLIWYLQVVLDSDLVGRELSSALHCNVMLTTYLYMYIHRFIISCSFLKPFLDVI